MVCKVIEWAMVLFASSTLMFPLAAPFFFVWLGSKSWLHLACVCLFLGWYCTTYDGSERRTGRVWLPLRTFWLPCHPYFPISCSVWDGEEYTSEPNAGHGEQFDLTSNQYIFGLFPHGPLPLSASVLLPQVWVV
jgi:hypothetical protein